MTDQPVAATAPPPQSIDACVINRIDMTGDVELQLDRIAIELEPA